MEFIGPRSQTMAHWKEFLKSNETNLETIKGIDFTSEAPVVTDKAGRKFSIDFLTNKKNYHKVKSGLRTELISKAMGAGKRGLNVLDLSAGLGIDAIFLWQMGYSLISIERNPIVYLALETALKNLAAKTENTIEFKFDSAEKFLKKTSAVFDVIYFDPMFPEKKKSALPRQEMILFRELVGSDSDASSILNQAVECKKANRIVVKRPLKAELLRQKPQSQLFGKLIRFDIYGSVQ